MATREELQRMRGASPSAFTPFSQARGAEALRGFGSGMAPRLSEPQSIFGASAQQSSQDFARLQMPATPNIPLGNTVPVFPDNYNQVMGERMRAPSFMVSGIREGNVSGFSPYSQTVPSMGGLTQTPSMAPTTNAITSFGNPLASRTERITSQYGTASTTLTPEQQTQRFQARQEAERKGTMPRSPEQQQALLAQMRTQGAAIGQRLATQESERQQGLRQGYYAFRQGIAERQAQEALSTERGRSPDVMRGAQAMLEAERMRQVQQGRSPMSREPLEVRGMQFRQTGMGQFAPIRGFGDTWATSFVSGGPQPMQAAQTTPSAPMATTQPSSFWQTAAQATPSITAPVQFPSAPMTGVITGTPFASRIVQPEEDRLRGLTTAMGLASRGRARPMPFGLRGAI